MNLGIGEIVIVLLVLLLVVTFGVIVVLGVRGSRSADKVDPDLWAKRHGFLVTSRSRPWVARYLRTGRNLRQVCGLGGLFVAGAVTAATGLDLELNGVIWILVGYLTGAVWAELSLTRLPLGSVRSASLESRSLRDYLAPRMLRAQVWVPGIALIVFAVALFVRGQVVATEPGSGVAGGNFVVDPANDGGLFATTVVATFLVVVTGVVVWLAQRHVVNRPQPTADAFLSAADDALRSSSAYTLSATGTCITWLLIATQCGYLVDASFDVDRPWLALAGPAILASIFLAIAFFMARNTPWQVRRRAPSDDPVPTEEPTWTSRRSPVPVAVGVIVVMTALGWGIRAWGPMNPAIEVRGMGGTTALGNTISWTELGNESRSEVELIDATVISGTDSNGVTHKFPEVDASITVAAGTRMDVTSPGDALPAEIPAKSTAVVTVSTPFVSSNCTTDLMPISPQAVELTFRTSSGRTMTRTVRLSSNTPVECVRPLPSGAPPADAEAAEQAIRTVVTTVYSPPYNQAKLDDISDPTGVAETMSVAAARYPDQVSETRVMVGEISFDSPTHAWFRYDLSAGFSSRVGEAVLVDGQWKVARQTICADLALANATCPALPG